MPPRHDSTRFTKQQEQRYGDKVARDPIAASGRAHRSVRVSTVPTAGRGAYTGLSIRYRVVSDSLTVELVGTNVTFYNKIESTAGTAFLRPGDEVTVWNEDGIAICSEWPRGYV